MSYWWVTTALWDWLQGRNSGGKRDFGRIHHLCRVKLSVSCFESNFIAHPVICLQWMSVLLHCLSLIPVWKSLKKLFSYRKARWSCCLHGSSAWMCFHCETATSPTQRRTFCSTSTLSNYSNLLLRLILLRRFLKWSTLLNIKVVFSLFRSQQS